MRYFQYFILYLPYFINYYKNIICMTVFYTVITILIAMKFRIDKSRYAVCEAIVSANEFTTVSQLLDFAMHDYYYFLTVEGGSVSFTKRSRDEVVRDLTPRREVVVRLSEMLNINMISLADYALEHHFARRGIVRDDGSYDLSVIQLL